MMAEIAKRPAKVPEGSADGEASSDYDIFWESFGKFIKLGVLDDAPNRSGYLF